MQPGANDALKQRVIRAAEAALAEQDYVSPIDVLTGMGLLARSNVEAWRKGRLEFLEPMIQGSAKKLEASLELFAEWARARNLQPTEARYVRRTPAGAVELQVFSGAGPAIEKFFRTHYVSPNLTDRKRQKPDQTLSQPPEPVVFLNRRDALCSTCGAGLDSGSFLYLDAGKPLCLACARLDDLEYLPSGDAALTRRAARYSQRRAVVVRFSRSRGRYERQGILVEKAALERAGREV